ncbi:MAG: GC-type dockerin domain-anchored protein [Planctomycetota bacterium]
MARSTRLTAAISMSLLAGAALAQAPVPEMYVLFNDGGFGPVDTTNATVNSIVRMNPAGSFYPEFEYANGKLWIADGGLVTGPRVLVVDPVTGIVEREINYDLRLGAPARMTAMEEANGRLYGAVSTLGQSRVGVLVEIDMVSGEVRFIGGLPSEAVSGLAWDGTTMYACVGGGMGAALSGWLLDVDLVSGGAALVGQLTGVDSLTGLEFGSDGVLYGLDRTGGGKGNETLVSIDIPSRSATPIGQPGNLDGQANALTLVSLTPTPVRCWRFGATVIANDHADGPLQGVTGDITIELTVDPSAPPTLFDPGIDVWLPPTSAVVDTRIVRPDGTRTGSLGQAELQIFNDLPVEFGGFRDGLSFRIEDPLNESETNPFLSSTMVFGFLFESTVPIPSAMDNGVRQPLGPINLQWFAQPILFEYFRDNSMTPVVETLRAEITSAVVVPKPCSPADRTTTGATIPGQPGIGLPDGKVDLDDLGFFLNLWLRNAADADVTTTGATLPGQPGFGVSDGSVGLDDLGYFLASWLSGCP